MLPLAIGAGIAGAQLIGGMLTNRQQMKFDERMSSTAYQRAVKDMRKAGLNPALAYAQGGASSPQVTLTNPVDRSAQTVSNAVVQKRELELMDAQRSSAQWAASKSAADAEYQTRYVRAGGAEADAAKIRADTEYQNSAKSLASAQAERTRQEGAKAGVTGRLSSEANDVLDSVFHSGWYERMKSRLLDK